MALLLQQATTQGAPAKKIPLFRILTRVGSSTDNDIIVEGPEVAPDHATIFKDENAYYLAVVGRSRPTFINGKKIKKELLHQGDVITIGGQNFTFYEKQPPEPKEEKSASLSAFRQIVTFSQELLAAKSLDEMLPRILDMVIALTKADKAFLLLFEQEKPEVVLARNIERQDVTMAMSQLSDTIVAKVVKDKEPLIVADALSNSEFSAAASVMNLKLCSVMCVPLLEAGELLGLIYVGSNRAVSLFGTEQLEILTVFGAEAALIIQNLRQKKALYDDNEALRKELNERRFGDIIGAAPAMEAIYRVVSKVAPTDIALLITGETGTGKELIAHEIHRRSNRADKPFVVINCGAIPENLLESELFGHVRGAFTGAFTTRNGKFQQANGGTLFLDEVGELPLSLQVKLLRALQEHTVCKLGSNAQETVDIRVISATNRNLAAAIKEGTFREDLYYRLNVVALELAPPRERGADILLLSHYFLKKFAAEYGSHVRDFSPAAAAAIKRYSWPGNIRQLENTLKKAVVMAEHSQISPKDLALDNKADEPVLPLAQAKDEFQRRYINEILERNNGNRTKTAKELGVDPRTIFRHLEREGELLPSSFDEEE